MKLAGTLIVMYVLLVLAGIAGWITNVIWTFHQDSSGNILLGILGTLAAPIGAIHGIYLWF